MTELLASFDFSMLKDPAWHIQLLSSSAAWCILATEKGKKRKPLYVEVLRFAAFYLILLFGMLVINVTTTVFTNRYFMIIWELVYGLLALAFYFSISRYPRSVMVCNWFSLYGASLAILGLAGQLSVMIAVTVGTPILQSGVRALLYLSLIPIAFYLRRFNLGAFGGIPKAGVLLILTGNFCLLCVSMLESSELSLVVTHIYSFICIYCMLLAVVLVSIYAIYTMSDSYEKVNLLKAEKQQLASEKEITRVSEQTLEDLRCIRHDLKNQYGYMRILLKEQRYEELDRYFDKVSDNLPIPAYQIDCGNRIVNTILNTAIAKARAAGITVERKLVVPPVLPFSENDLCSLLSNLLDNAIEETVRMQEAGKPENTIYLSIYPQKSYLYIVCRNATLREGVERRHHGFKTSKKDELLHGYGTRIITKIAERYNGEVEFLVENGNFTAKVLLDMMEDTTDEA